MPLYDFKCIECGKITEFLVDQKDLEKEKENINLSPKFCPSCKNSNFYRLPAAHGKTPVNWSSWQSPGPKKPKK